MLAVGMFGQLAGTLVVSTPPFLIPHLHLTEDVSWCPREPSPPLPRSARC